MCVCVCVRACVRARVRARACVRAHVHIHISVHTCKAVSCLPPQVRLPLREGVESMRVSPQRSPQSSRAKQ